MDEKIKKIHDYGYKRLFSHPGFVKELLESFIDMKWVKKIDFNALKQISTSFIRQNYINKETDVIYKLRYKKTQKCKRKVSSHLSRCYI